MEASQLAPAERLEQQAKLSTGHRCQGACCACRPIRVMRDNCLKNNQAEECSYFVDAFKECVEHKKAEIAARKLMAA